MRNKKKIILISFFVILVIIISGLVIFWLLNKNKVVEAQSDNSVAGSGSVGQLNLSQGQSIPLGGEEKSQDSDNGLKVADGTSNNPANLGSGYRSSPSSNGSASNSGNNSSGSSVPGPESFGQYEKYKDDKSALFGDLQIGTGSEAAVGKKVAVYYKGWLTNGQLFDQSIDKTFVFTIGAHQVIPGWEQDIIGMKIGGVRRMIIPPTVGYGAKGQGPIPANAVLIFDVQLAAVE